MRIEKILYRAADTASGSREGQARSSDGVLEPALTIAEELGGNGTRGSNRPD